MKRIFLILFFLTSCVNVNLTGQYIHPSDLLKITIATSDQQEVQSILGSPTRISQINKNVWYYVSRKMKTSPLARPSLIEQKVVTITFDNAGKVIDIKSESSKANLYNAIDKSTTHTYGNKEQGHKHFMRNFGKFNTKPTKKR